MLRGALRFPAFLFQGEERPGKLSSQIIDFCKLFLGFGIILPAVAGRMLMPLALAVPGAFTQIPQEDYPLHTSL